MNKQDHFDSKAFQKALLQYEEARRSGEEIYLDSDVLTSIAEYYDRNQRTAEAIETIDYAIRLFPGSVLPLVFRARMAWMIEDNIEGAKLYLACVTDKDCLEYYYTTAEIKITEGLSDEANQYLYDHISDVEDDELDSYFIEVAILFADYDEFELANQWMERCEDDTDPDYWETMGRIEMGLGHLEESERIFTDLIDKDPFCEAHWNHLAATQLLENKFIESISSSGYSLAINPNDAEALLNKGNGLFALGQNEEALKCFEKFAALCPKEVNGEMMKGMVLAEMKKNDEALFHLYKAESLCQKNDHFRLQIYEQIAYILSKQDKLDEALAYVDKCEDLPLNEPFELSLLRGHLYLEHQETGKAAKIFHEALVKSKNTPEMYLKIAVSFLDNGYADSAYEILKNMSGVTTRTQLPVYPYLAVCCLELGYQQEYEEAVKKAVCYTPAEAKLVLGPYFPDEMEPEDYYHYLINNKNNFS